MKEFWCLNSVQGLVETGMILQEVNLGIWNYDLHTNLHYWGVFEDNGSTFGKPFKLVFYRGDATPGLVASSNKIKKPGKYFVGFWGGNHFKQIVWYYDVSLETNL